MDNSKLLIIDELCDYSLIDIELLKSKNIDVIFAFSDINQYEINKRPNKVYLPSFSFEDIFAAVKHSTPNYIVCMSEEYFYEVSGIREMLSIPGMSMKTSKKLSDKYIMNQIAMKGGLNTPHTKLLDIDDSYSNLKEVLGSKIVFIKPTTKTGSFETYKIKNELDYKSFLKNKRLALEQYIAQEFIDGELYHSEVIVSKGEIKFLHSRKYTSPNADMVFNQQPIFSANISNKEMKNLLDEASLRLVASFGIKNGVYHNEFFIRNEEALFLETNARAPGIGLNHMYAQMLGVSLETLLCLIVCNVELPPIISDEYKYFCGYFPVKKGTVLSVNTLEMDVKSKWEFFVKQGDVLKSHSSMTKSAMVICWDNELSKIEKNSEKLLSHEVLELE